MKIRSIINMQVEFDEELSEEDFAFFINNSNKSKTKQIIEQIIKDKLNSDKVLVKSYRMEEDKENDTN